MTTNITFVTDCPQAARPPRFFVTATENIVEPHILAGDYLLIDPDAQPVAGKLVLIGESLERWNGQAGVSGVAVSVNREM